MPRPRRDDKPPINLKKGVLKMNKRYYALELVVNGHNVNFDREFDSRKSAMDYAFSYFDKHGNTDLSINEEYYVNDNIHDIEYVSDYNNRFRVVRVA